jgi:L-lactate utilization protein LutC
MADVKTIDTGSAAGLVASDSKLIERKEVFGTLFTKYSAAASTDAFERTVRGLTERKFVVKVVENRAEALKAALSEFPADGSASSFSLGGAQSLTEIGFTEWAKTQTLHLNHKALALANWGKPDFVKHTRNGFIADNFFTTPSAVTEGGQLLWASASGTRVSLVAGKTIFIVGSNKIVPNLEAAWKRLDDYVVPLSGAQVRAKFGFPDTYAMETGILNGQAMMNPGQFVIVLCKEPLGF